MIANRSVLLTADTVGGVWTFAVELARALEPHQVQVHLATMGGWMSNQQLAEVRKLSNVEVYESRFRLEWMETPWDDVRRAGDWLLRLENRLAPDVVHLNGYAHANLPWQAPVVATGHSCVLSWWRAVKGESAGPEWDEYRSRVRAGLRSASLVTAPTCAMLRALIENYGPLANGIVIPNGVAPDRFAPKDKEPFVLAAGRLWDEAKNIAVLDSIAPRLRWPVMVAGDDRHPDGSRFQARNVRALGYLSAAQMTDHVARAAVFAHPARYEPFGLSVLEAALSGCALVLGDIPSLRENWDGAAVFVDPDDLAGWQHSIGVLIADADVRARLAANACARALNFSSARMAQAYLSAYESVMVREEVRSCA